MTQTAYSTRTYYYSVDVYTDASSKPNPGPSAVAVRVVDPSSDEVLFEDSGYVGETTVVKAEYLSVIVGIDSARKFTSRKVNVYSDNMVVVKQASRIFRVHQRNLEPYLLRVRGLVDSYFREGVEFAHLSEGGKLPSFNKKHHDWCDKQSKKVAEQKRPIFEIEI